MKELGDVDFEYLFLVDADLKPCRGCFTCFMKGEQHCPIKDDHGEIARKLEEADGVIFASPVYSMHVTYLMKTFIDRFAYTFHRPCYFGKYAIGVSTAGGIGLKEALDYLRMVATSWGFEYVDEVGLCDPPKPLPPVGSQNDRTAQVAARFYTAIRERRPRKLSLSDHIHFRAMRAVYFGLGELSPTDYEYWRSKGWFDKRRNYFCENVRSSLLKDLFARYVAWNVSRGVRKAIAQTRK